MQVLYEMQFAGTGTGDEDLTLDSDLTRYHSRDGVYAPSPSAMSPPLPPKREGTGVCICQIRSALLDMRARGTRME